MRFVLKFIPDYWYLIAKLLIEYSATKVTILHSPTVYKVLVYKFAQMLQIRFGIC